MCGDCTCIAYGIWSIVYSMSVFELCQLSRYFSFDLVVAICHQSQICQVSLDDPTMSSQICQVSITTWLLKWAVECILFCMMPLRRKRKKNLCISYAFFLCIFSADESGSFGPKFNGPWTMFFLLFVVDQFVSCMWQRFVPPSHPISRLSCSLIPSLFLNWF